MERGTWSTELATFYYKPNAHQLCDLLPNSSLYVVIAEAKMCFLLYLYTAIAVRLQQFVLQLGQRRIILSLHFLK